MRSAPGSRAVAASSHRKRRALSAAPGRPPRRTPSAGHRNSRDRRLSFPRAGVIVATLGILIAGSLWLRFRSVPVSSVLATLPHAPSATVQETLGDAVGAEAAYRRAIGSKPQEAGAVPAWHRLGLLALEQGRLDDARQALGAARILVPGEPRYWVDFGRTYAASSDPRERQ